MPELQPIEIRTLRDLSVVQVRDHDSPDEEAKKPIIAGYAAVFGKRSEDLGGFREEIQAGAFSNSLKRKDDVRALVEHDPARIIGRSTSGTLQLEEDKQGLRVEIDPPKNTQGADVMESIRRGDLDAMSFAFRVPAGGDSWDEDPDGTPVRTVQAADLRDVSVVAYPAYVDTEVALRSLGRSKIGEPVEATPNHLVTITSTGGPELGGVRFETVQPPELIFGDPSKAYGVSPVAAAVDAADELIAESRATIVDNDRRRHAEARLRIAQAE